MKSSRTLRHLDKALKAAIFAIVALASSVANAVVVTQWSVTVDSTFDPASIVDSNGQSPGDVVISNGNRTLEWGDTLQSGLDITNSPVSTTVDTSIMPNLLDPVGNVFVTHTNQPITGTTLDKVTMQNQITLEALVPPTGGQTPVVLNFTIDFQETVNSLDPCPDGTPNYEGVNINGCSDIFVISADALNHEFTYDTGDGDLQTYYLSLVELTGGLMSLSSEACLAATGSADPCLGFVTPESGATSFQFGTIISTQEVEIIPTPGALSLMGLGLVTLAGLRRRRT